MNERDVQEAATVALSNILAPLIGFSMDIGLSARELQDICRAVAVTIAADRQREGNLRVSISGIAAITGIPRAEVSKILKVKKVSGQLPVENRPHSINKILSAWHENPSFTNRSGRPSDLKIYGSGRTFESLVIRNGGGLPVRAVLDELIRTGSVEIVSPNKLKLRAPIFLDRGFNRGEMKIVGRKLAQMIENMLAKFRKSESQFMLSDIEGEILDDAALPVFRKEVVSSTGDLLTGLRESLFRTSNVRRKNKPPYGGKRIRVTVLYQEIPNLKKSKTVLQRRKNFRRTES